MDLSLEKLAEICDGEVVGDKSLRLSGVLGLHLAKPTQLSIYTNKAYTAQLNKSKAGAILTDEVHSKYCSGNLLIVQNPMLALARILRAFEDSDLNQDKTLSTEKHISQSARISKSAKLGKHVHIGANAVIGSNVKLADGVRIGAGSVIEQGVSIGLQSRIDANVTIYHACIIGQKCHISSGAIIGADGFGFAEDKSQIQASWVAVPQVSIVSIGNDVHIGANTTIDRGSLGNTIIEDDVIIDNLIQIGHNVHIGQHTAIAGCTAIAGSTKIGKNCKIAGHVSIDGHIELCDQTVVFANSLVTKSITKPGIYSSSMPAMPVKQWRKMLARIRLQFARN